MTTAHPVPTSPTAVPVAAAARPRGMRRRGIGKGAHGVVRGDSQVDLK